MHDEWSTSLFEYGSRLVLAPGIALPSRLACEIFGTKMADLRWVTRKGKKVLLLDFTQRAGVAVEQLARELQQITTAQPRASVLVLADFTGVNFSDNASKQIASAAAAVDRPHVLRTAWVAPRRGLTVRHPAVHSVSISTHPNKTLAGLRTTTYYSQCK